MRKASRQGVVGVREGGRGSFHETPFGILRAFSSPVVHLPSIRAPQADVWVYRIADSGEPGAYKKAINNEDYPCIPGPGLRVVRRVLDQV
ncbi:hypothetical protein J6590_004257 [Homalodisca vitripennis]|nr:hypothetical protein J6590_004257 [Homalodisca vitripennis]